MAAPPDFKHVIATTTKNARISGFMTPLWEIKEVTCPGTLYQFQLERLQLAIFHNFLKHDILYSVSVKTSVF